MGFWGIEVKPGTPYSFHSDNVPGRLHITQATLGLGSSTERSIVQCSIGHKSPVFLCSLLPSKNESSPLNLEFDEDDLVAFSVLGPRSVHLSGYYEVTEGDGIRADDSFGEDIAETESESESSEYDSGEYDNDFIDYEDEEEDFVMFPPSPARSSGVVIEEIVDDEKPANEKGQSKRQKKKNQANGSGDKSSSEKKIVVRGESSGPVLESEDEDGFPMSTKNEGKLDVQKLEAEVKSMDDGKEETKKKKVQDGHVANNLKRKVKTNDEEGRPEKEKKKKKQQLKGQVGHENSDEERPEELKSTNVNQATSKTDEHEEKLANEKILDVEMNKVPGESQPEEKKKKKKKNKKKNQNNEEGANGDQTVTAQEDKKKSTSDSEQKQTDAKPSKVRTFPNGLVIEELAMGKPDGKRASPGKQVSLDVDSVPVSVHYIGKLQKNGNIFDSNVGRAPFKFRLGVNQVISGWDVGVNGMRVGDKRRLTIPPEMGYGSKGAGGKIPPNAWLVFDVELVNVR